MSGILQACPSDDDYMPGYGCGVSQYPQFFVGNLDMYQMLPRPYLRSFYGGPGDKLKKNWVGRIREL